MKCTIKLGKKIQVHIAIHKFVKRKFCCLSVPKFNFSFFTNLFYSNAIYFMSIFAYFDSIAYNILLSILNKINICFINYLLMENATQKVYHGFVEPIRNTRNTKNTSKCNINSGDSQIISHN